MRRLKEFNDCRIAIYPRDHRPPHVHVEFRDGSRCAVEIGSLKIMGNIRPASKLSEALDWIAKNHDLLLTKWEEIVK